MRETAMSGVSSSSHSLRPVTILARACAGFVKGATTCRISLMATVAPKGLHLRIFAVVSRIPRGRVASYGQIARLAGMPGQARLVGYALHAVPRGRSIPWQRVVNAKGAISLPADHGSRQRYLLEREGVRFDSRGRIPFASFQWRPKAVIALSPAPRARRSKLSSP